MSHPSVCSVEVYSRRPEMLREISNFLIDAFESVSEKDISCTEDYCCFSYIYDAYEEYGRPATSSLRLIAEQYDSEVFVFRFWDDDDTDEDELGIMFKYGLHEFSWQGSIGPFREKWLNNHHPDVDDEDEQYALWNEHDYECVHEFLEEENLRLKNMLIKKCPEVKDILA